MTATPEYRIIDPVTAMLINMVWLQGIPDFPGYYVTREGQVLSMRRRGGNYPGLQWKWMAQRARTDRRTCRHPRTDLFDSSGRRRTVKVHRLVAAAWLGEGHGYMVCHKDGNVENPRAGNLYYGTERDNSLDREFHRREGKGRIRWMEDWTGTLYPVEESADDSEGLA